MHAEHPMQGEAADEEDLARQEAAEQPQSKAAHVRGVLAWGGPAKPRLPVDAGAPWQMHIPAHLAAMLAASEGRCAPGLLSGQQEEHHWGGEAGPGRAARDRCPTSRAPTPPSHLPAASASSASCS